MSDTIRAAVVGFGNVGRFAVDAVLEADDFELAGIIRRNVSVPGSTPECRWWGTCGLGDVDVVLLCTPTRSVPEQAEAYLSKGINPVDSYDIHGELVDLRNRLDGVARRHGSWRSSPPVRGSGYGLDDPWDAGIDGSRGITYTNFGPGMSMGHSVTAKAAPGVRDALSLTIPTGQGVHQADGLHRARRGRLL